MLKIKHKPKMTKKKAQIYKDLEKNDDIVGLYVRIPRKDMKRLRHELLKRDITMVKWIEEKIGEI